MNRIVTAAAVAAASAAATWAARWWLEQRQLRKAHLPHKVVESWENEGGSLAPRRLTTSASQVPR